MCLSFKCSRTIQYTQVARELLAVSGENEQLKIKVDGYVSNANYNRKKGTYIFFINHRLIENSALKKVIRIIDQSDLLC